MGWGFLLRSWLQRMAEEKIREKVVEAARQQMAAATTAQDESASAADQPCQVGLIYAMSAESGGLEDLLEDVVTLRGEGFRLRQGTLAGHRVAVALSGAGRKAAVHATEALITGHHPRWVISAGFCGGLSPTLPRHAIVVADRIADAAGNVVEVQPGAVVPLVAGLSGATVGRLLSVREIVRRPKEKRALGEQHQALAVDLESLAVAAVCRDRGVPFLAVRVVSDAVDDELPPEVAGLARQKSTAGQFGAALASILNRPGSVKDMYKLKENALVSSDRLARFLAKLIPRLADPPALPP